MSSQANEAELEEGGGYSTIRVSRENKGRLAKYGDVQMSFDDVVGEILDILETEVDGDE